ncbi:MAG: MCE family protein [Planctomycetes bacterium]|nr:MCE family protein [Planctomycetota bacterium]
MTPDCAGAPPQAVVKPERRISLAWILPLLVLVLSGWLGFRALALRGIDVAVLFLQGHGLKPGDEVRYHGTAIGEVRAVELDRGAHTIRVALRLEPGAERFARAGARFWIVRPQVSLAGVRGLETLLGSRHVAALPGTGASQRSFVGLEEPLIVDDARPGDLEILLEAAERGNLGPGTPVTFREIQVGTVLSAGLSADARQVEARVHIQAEYAPLVREKSRFWNAGGVGASWGSRLLWMEVGGSLARALLGGSVAFATPENGGAVVATGHRFELVREPEEEWQEWQPAIALGSALLPGGCEAPRPVRARLTWKEGLLNRQKGRSGWLLQTREGLLGPADLLGPPAEAKAGSAALEAGGAVVPLDAPLAPRGTGLSLLDARVPGPVWERPAGAPCAQPVECLAFGDQPAAPLPLAAQRLEPIEGGFQVHASFTVDARWHGASVLSRETGELLGMLLVEEDGAKVAFARAGEAPPPK